MGHAEYSMGEGQYEYEFSYGMVGCQYGQVAEKQYSVYFKYIEVNN